MEYKDVLWRFVPDELREEKVNLSVFPNEASYYEASDKDRGEQVIKVRLPLLELIGGKDYQTKLSQHRITASEALAAGRKLWGALPEMITAPIREHSLDDPPLRIKISSPAMRVMDLPWEWLADEQGKQVALSPNLRLVRSVPLRFPIPHLTVRLPVRVLIVLTNPKDERLLDPVREVDAIKQSLRPPAYEMQICPEPSFKKLREMLHDFLPHALHYIGHAGLDNGEGNIILHEEGDRNYWLCSAELLKVLPSSVRLICLSACFTAPNYQILGLSHLAHSPREVNLPTMVTNQYFLEERSIRTFWTEFYSTLITAGGNVNEALHSARRLAAEQCDPAFADWASFSLVLRDLTGEALRIVTEHEEDLESIQANELQAQFAASLANELAQQAQVKGAATPEGIRERLEVETKRAADRLKSVK
ncbi:MAG TPA: CHAT domain-containing protein [Blastocatellia bacterium]|nr:CHAT domain-containing protein [Blastocatellia bacterium]